MLAEELYLHASRLFSRPLDTSQPQPQPQPQDFGALFQQYVNQFVSDVSQALLTIDSTVVILSKLAFITLLLLGVFLYFTRLHRRLGKDLIYGGVVLAILSEVVFPLISNS